MRRPTIHTVVRCIACVAMALLPLAAGATQPNMRVSGELAPAEQSVLRGDGDPVIYNHYSTAAALAADPERPHLGTALTYAGSGPQMQVSGLRVFLHSQIDQTHERIRVEVKFWSRHDAASSPVFSQSPAAGLVEIELVGPYILQANRSYAVTATLPEPVLVESHVGTGISMHVLVGGVGDEQLVEDPGLLPAYNSGAANAVGVPIAHYAELLGTRNDHNFAATDTYAHALAVTLYGRADRLVQCGNWPQYRTHLVDEFDDVDGLLTRWSMSANGGNVLFREDGSFTLSNGGPSPRFPYLQSRGTPIPPTGEFSVRWRARYLSASPNGTGSLVISRGLPVNGSSDDEATRAAWAWQDTVGGFAVRARTVSGAAPSPVFQAPAGAGTAVHDIEYCWLDSTVELWVDGTRVLQQARNANVQRPDSLWIGNPVNTGDSNGQWNAIQLYRVHVRAPFVDRIFTHGFDAGMP